MIAYIDSHDGNSLKSVEKLCSAGGVCACRIMCLINSYSVYDGLLQLWLQYDGSMAPTSVILKYAADMTVLASNGTDISELKEFILAVGAASISSEIEIFEGSREDVIMRLGEKKQIDKNDSENTFVFDNEVFLSEAYMLLKSCETEKFICPSEADFMLDTSHKIRHDQAHCCELMIKEKPAAFVMTAALTDECAVIGAVCTDPRYRNKGFGSTCIRRLIELLGSRDIYIVRAVLEHEAFYRSLGFENTGKYYTYIENT